MTYDVGSASVWEGAFGADIDYAQLVKLYGTAPESAEGRYSAAECIGARKERIEGNPDPKHVSCGGPRACGLDDDPQLIAEARRLAESRRPKPIR